MINEQTIQTKHLIRSAFIVTDGLRFRHASKTTRKLGRGHIFAEGFHKRIGRQPAGSSMIKQRTFIERFLVSAR